MKAEETAIILIGYQNDYFAKDGILHQVIEDDLKETNLVERTTSLLERVKDTKVSIIHTPILFSPDYSELPNPVGLMAQIRDVGAFRRDTKGGLVIPEIRQFGDRIMTVTGKTGFNAFGGTNLDRILEERAVKNVVVAGVVTSVCVDSTGRAASECGYNVTILSDCNAGRTKAEHSFYCEDIFPLYANVQTTEQFLSTLEA